MRRIAARRESCADAFGQLDAVHTRHLIVQQREIESRPSSVPSTASASALDSLAPHLNAPGMQMLREDVAIAGVIVDDERAQSDQSHSR